MRPFESWRMRLDPPHCIAIVDPLTAVWTLAVLQVRNRIFLTLEASSPVTANLFDLLAAAGRTRCDLKHCYATALRIDSATSSSVRPSACISNRAFSLNAYRPAKTARLILTSASTLLSGVPLATVPVYYEGATRTTTALRSWGRRHVGSNAGLGRAEVVNDFETLSRAPLPSSPPRNG